MATTIVGGAATAPALHMLDLDCDGAMDDVASECPSAGEYSQLGSTQERGPHVWSARTMWRHMDSMFLKPIFGGRSSLERGGEQGESVGGGSGENGGGGGWWGGGRGAE